MGSPVKPIQQEDDYTKNFFAEIERKKKEEEERSKKMLAEFEAFQETQRNTGAMGEQYPNKAGGINESIANFIGIKKTDGALDLPSDPLGDLARGRIGQAVRKIGSDLASEFKQAKELGFAGTVKEVLAEDRRRSEAPGPDVGELVVGAWNAIYEPFVVNPISSVADEIYDKLGVSTEFRKKVQARMDELAPGVKVDMTPGEAQERTMETIANGVSWVAGLKAGQSIMRGNRVANALNIPKTATIPEILNTHFPNAIRGLDATAQAELYGKLSAGFGDVLTKGATEGVVGGLTYGLSSKDISPDALFQYAKAGAIMGGAFEGLSGVVRAGKNWTLPEGQKVPFDPKAKFMQLSLREQANLQTWAIGQQLAALTPEGAAYAAAKVLEGTDFITAYQSAMEKNSVAVMDGVPQASVPVSTKDSKFMVYNRPNGTAKVVMFGDGAWEIAQTKQAMRRANQIVTLEDGRVLASEKPFVIGAPVEKPVIAEIANSLAAEAQGLTDPDLIAHHEQIIGQLHALVNDTNITPEQIGAMLNDIVPIETLDKPLRKMKYDAVIRPEGDNGFSLLDNESNIIKQENLGEMRLETIPRREGGKPRVTKLSAPRKATLEDVKMLYPEDDLLTLDHDPTLDITDNVLVWDTSDGKKVAIDGQLDANGNFYVHMIRHSDGPGALGPTLVNDIKAWIGEITGAEKIGGFHIAGVDSKASGGGVESYIPTNAESAKRVFTEHESPIGPDQRREFELTGNYTGEEVSYNGQRFIYNGLRTNNRVSLVNPVNGKRQLVPRGDISGVDNPVTYKYNKELKLWTQLNPTNNIKPVAFSDNLDQIIGLLNERDKFLLTKNHLEAETIAGDKLTTLTDNGFFIDQGPGEYVIRRLDDPSYAQKVGTLNGVFAFVDEFMKLPTADELAKSVIGDALATANRGLAGSLNIGQRGEWGAGKKALDMVRVQPGINWVVPIDQMFRTLARRTGIELLDAKFNMNNANKAFHAELHPLMAQATAVLAPVAKLDAMGRANFMRYIESMSADELASRGTSGRPMSSEALEVSQRLLEKFTSEERQVGSRYISDLQRVQEQYAEGRIGRKAYEEHVEALKMKGNYGEPLTPKHLEVAGILEEVRGKYVPDQMTGKSLSYTPPVKPNVSVLEVLAHTDAKQNGALSRAQFAADVANGITPELQKAAIRYDLLMQKLAESTGIAVDQRMWQYAPHIKKYVGANAYDVKTFKHDGIKNPKMAQWAHELTRVGYYDMTQLVQDPLQLTSKYIYTAMRQKHLEPALLQLREKLADYAGYKPGTDEAKVPPNALKYAERAVDHIEAMVRHYTNPADMLAEASFGDWAKRAIGVEEKQAQDWVTTWLKWNEFKAQGFKPIAGMRDATSFLQSHMFHFGPSRTWKMMKLMNEAAKNADALSGSGVVGGKLDITRVVGPDLPPAIDQSKPKITQTKDRIVNTIGEGLDAAINMGFKWSMQPQVYKLAHAASYMEATQTFAEALTKLTKGEVSTDKFRRMTGMDLYPTEVEATFMKMINESKDFEGAIDYIAQRTGEMVVGQYGMLNNPMLYATKPGKVLGQFGQWPLWMLNAMGEGVTAGTSKEMALRASFIIGSSAAALYATDQVGVDFDRWTLNPLGMLPFGSAPMAQLITNTQQAFNRGSPLAPMYMGKLINQLEYLANPLPTQFKAMLESVQLMEQGAPVHIIGARFLGNGVDGRTYKTPGFNLWDF